MNLPHVDKVGYYKAAHNELCLSTTKTAGTCIHL